MAPEKCENQKIIDETKIHLLCSAVFVRVLQKTKGVYFSIVGGENKLMESNVLSRMENYRLGNIMKTRRLKRNNS